MLFNTIPCSRLGEAGVEVGEGVLCRGHLLLIIYFMPIVTNAVVFLHNIKCRIKTYKDKNPIFKGTSEAVTFQRALQRRQLWASWATLQGSWLVGHVEPGCQWTLLL